ncbi:MAG TPA: hypothetical protein VLZ83_00115 [Edaphocola sp.]|nr:hypothetical protein [Edaphocola sp.]
MKNQENWKNSTYFGVIMNLTFFLLVYVLTAFYLWKIINNTLIFIISYVLIILMIRFIITKIYSNLTTGNSPNEIIHKEFYGIDNRANWGGIFKELVPPNQKYLADACKESLKALRNKQETPEILKKIKELEGELREMKKDVITGGSIFELFFCLRRLL